VRDVRGFQDNTLGPKVCIGASGTSSVPNANGTCSNGYYQYAQPIGGAFKVLGTAQVFIPLPFLKDEGAATQFDNNAGERFTWAFVHIEVALGYAITRKAIDDNLRRTLKSF